LVSVVTGFPGGKSGARGYDLVMGNGTYGEIKTCYRVDQLGKCCDCEAVVSSLEKECSNCGSKNIKRKDDSKWLIGIQHDEEFKHILDPQSYFFVLFEFEELENINNDNIIASIWEVDPKTKGFGYCMMDYYLNIKANSKSGAPFNMWPYQFKFTMTQPNLIYRALIKGDGSIDTQVFPTKGNSYTDELLPLSEYSRATTLTLEVVQKVFQKFVVGESITGKSKTKLLQRLEEVRVRDSISNEDLCNAFADAVYLPLLEDKKTLIPMHLKQYYSELM